MSDMDEGDRLGDKAHSGEEKRTAQAKKEAEEAAEMEAFFKKHESRIAAAKLQRDADELKAQEYITRRAEAEKIIKSLAAERMQKAKGLGGKKARDTFLQHYVMVGHPGSTHGAGETPDADIHVYQGNKIGVTHVKSGQTLIALRFETTPGVVTFLVGHETRFKSYDSENLRQLITTIKQYGKPYVEVDPDILRKVMES